MPPSQDKTPPTWPASYAELLNDICERLRAVVAEEVRKALQQADPEVVRLLNEIDARVLASLCRLREEHPEANVEFHMMMPGLDVEYSMGVAAVARLIERGMIVRTIMQRSPPEGHAYWGPKEVEVYRPTPLGIEMNLSRRRRLSAPPAQTEESEKNKEKPDGNEG